MLWIYNKKLFEQAKLDPNARAQDLGRAADHLRSAEDGRHAEPLGGGIQDGYWSEWYISHSLPQNLDLARRSGRALHRRQGLQRSEVPRALGEARGAEDARLSSTRICPRSNFIRASTSCAGRQAGHGPVDRYAPAGRPEDGRRPDRRHGDADFGKGKLAGQPLLDVQGLGISSNAEDPKAAAAFLEFLTLARAAEGVLGRRPAGCRPTLPSTPA